MFRGREGKVKVVGRCCREEGGGERCVIAVVAGRGMLWGSGKGRKDEGGGELN